MIDNEQFYYEYFHHERLTTNNFTNNKFIMNTLIMNYFYNVLLASTNHLTKEYLLRHFYDEWSFDEG